MSIIPISRLQASDLSMLGNNLQSEPSHRARRNSRRRRRLAPVNRSLSLLGEQVDRLYPMGLGVVRCAEASLPV